MEYEPRGPTPDPNDPYGYAGSPDLYAASQANHARPTGTSRRAPIYSGGAEARYPWLARLQASNPLDGWIYTFQHRWETSAEYRRIASIVIAVSAVVALCACVSLATTLTTAALAGAPSAGAGGASNTGTNTFNGPHAFPTNTVPSWPTPVIPNANPIPNSQTPVPSPTAPAGPVKGCAGGQQGIDWELSPCPQSAGQSGRLHVYARRYSNIGVSVSINFGCSDSGCTLNYTPDSIVLDATGSVYVSYTVPAAAANSQVNITGSIQPQGGPQISIVAAPVQ